MQRFLNVYQVHFAEHFGPRNVYNSIDKRIKRVLSILGSQKIIILSTILDARNL